MIERIAQAIFDKDPEGLFTIHHAEVYARAALEAMREPTKAMLDAADAAHPRGYGRETPLTTIIGTEWRAMIDAALKEK
jgi:hypothetical protein